MNLVKLHINITFKLQIKFHYNSVFIQFLKNVGRGLGRPTEMQLAKGPLHPERELFNKNHVSVPTLDFEGK